MSFFKSGLSDKSIELDASRLRVLLGSLGMPPHGGVDSNAIHDNVASEISAILEKLPPVSRDFLIIEDSDDSENKKSITLYGLLLSLLEPYATNASTALTTPTSDGSGAAIHPSVVDAYVEKGYGQTWNSYRYWMAMTPFDGGDITLENPEILASNDGDTWVVPGGLTNPIDGTYVGSHHADTDLILGQDDVMYCYYVDVTESNPDTIRMKVMSSSDGTTWGSETTLFTNTAADSGASPSVIWDGSQYVMYYIDYSGATYSMVKRTCATPDGTWSSESACTVNNIPSGENIWNIDIWKRGDVYHGLFGMWDDPKNLYFGTSTDGTTFTLDDAPILTPGAAGKWDDGFLYRACMVPTADGYDMWYSANDQPTTWNSPRIGRTKIYLNADAGVNTDKLWQAKGDLAVGQAYYTAQRLAVGTDGHVLTADSAEALGVKWAASASVTSTSPHWEPAVIAAGDEIMFDADGDVAMVWIS